MHICLINIWLDYSRGNSLLQGVQGVQSHCNQGTSNMSDISNTNTNTTNVNTNTYTNTPYSVDNMSSAQHADTMISLPEYKEFIQKIVLNKLHQVLQL